MNHRTIGLAITLVALALATALGGENADTSNRAHLVVELRDGSRVVGVGCPTIELETSVGRVSIPLDQVVRMQVGVGQHGKPASVTTKPDSDLATGLVAYYPFDGDAKDASGNGNHGTVRGCVEFVDGIVGKAARFPGFEKFGQIEVANSKTLQFTDQFSVAFWMRIRSEAGQSGFTAGKIAKAPQVILGKRGDATGFVVISTDDNRPRSFGLWSNRTVAGESLLVGPMIGRWRHMAATTSRTGTKVYCDGSLIGSSDKRLDFTAANGQDMVIGAQSIGVFRYPFNGDLDDLRIYNRALTAGEIETLYGRDKAKADAINATCDMK